MAGFATSRIMLTSLELKEVQNILREQVPEYEVWAFGSRVRGDARKYSDLDLAVLTEAPLSLSRMADLRAAFDESGLVFKVDVVDWATTSDSFRKIIESQRIVLQEAGGEGHN